MFPRPIPRRRINCAREFYTSTIVWKESDSNKAISDIILGTIHIVVTQNTRFAHATTRQQDYP